MNLSQQEAFEDSHGSDGKIWKYAQCAKIGDRYYPIAIFKNPSYIIDINKRINHVRAQLKISQAELNNRLHLAGLYAIEASLDTELTSEQTARERALSALAELEAKAEYETTLHKMYLAIGNEDDFISYCVEKGIPEADCRNAVSNMGSRLGTTKEDEIIIWLANLMRDGPMHTDQIKEAVERCNIGSWSMVSKVASNANYSSNDPRRGYWRRLPAETNR